MAAPDAVGPASRAAVPDCGRRRSSTTSATPVTPPSSSAARCATRCWAATPPTGTWPPTRAPTGSSRCSRAAVYENRFGTVAVRRDDDVFEITTFRTEHEYADFRRPHRVEFGDDDRSPTSPAATSPSTRWPGAAWPADDGAQRPGRPVRRAAGTWRPAACAPWATRTRGSARTRCAWSGPSGWRRRWASRSSPRPWRRSRANAGLVGHLSGERIGAELAKLLGRAPAVRRPPARAGDRPARGHLAGPRGAARDPAEQGPGRGPLGPHAAHRGRRPGRPPGRPARRARSTTSASRRPSSDGHFHHHDAVGRGLADALLRRLRYPRARRRGGRPPRPAPHVPGRPGRHRRRRPAIHQADRARATSTRCSRCAARTTSAAAWTPDDPDHARVPGPHRARSSRPRRRSTATRSRSTATT